ncbi:MAG: hypothetical protein U9N56_04075 [Actinomycetota bacterium]|nr:hypothetical protein [Actinomycetota bacterium]
MTNHLNSRDAVQDLIRDRVEQSDAHTSEEQSNALARLLAMAWETRHPLATAG